MKDCIYTIKVYGKQESFDRELLLLFMYLNGIKNVEDLRNVSTFGHADLGVIDTIANHIDKFLDKNLLMQTATMLGDDYSYSEGAISVCQYIDKIDLQQHRANPGIRMEINNEELLEYFMRSGDNRDEARKKLNTTIKNWNLISENGRLLHRIFADYTNLLTRKHLPQGDENRLLRREAFFDMLGNYEDIAKLFDATAMNALFDAIESTRSKIHRNILGQRPENWSHTRFVSSHLYGYAKTELEEKLLKIGCHVDELYIGSDGHIFIFNYKVTTHKPSEWSENMSKKYMYEMAFIKKMLLAAGITSIDPAKISMFNIPIYILYNQNTDGSYDKITNVQSEEPITYAIYNGSPKPLLDAEREIENIVLPLPSKKLNEEEEYMFRMNLDALLEQTNPFLSAVLPVYDANAKGMQVAAKNWVKKHNGTDIIYDNERELWKIVFNDQNIKYVDFENEILPCVEENISLIQDGEPVVVELLIKEIQRNYAENSFTFRNSKGFNMSAAYALKSFQMYLNTNEKGEHEWLLVLTGDKMGDILWNCGILMFRNKNTKQIDVIIPSGFDVHEIILTDFKTNNILGYYESDMNSPTDMPKTYGNMEILRALSVINELIGKGGFEDCKFGNIQVITPNFHGEGIHRSFIEVVPHFTKIVNYLNDHNILEYKNNFNKAKMIATSELLFNLKQKIETNDNVSQQFKKQIISNLSLDAIEDIKGNEAIAMKLIEIVKSIEASLQTDSSERILELRTSGNKEQRLLAALWIECVDGINHFNGMYSPQVKHIATWERMILPLYANPDENVRYIANIYTHALDNIATRFLEEYNPIRDRIIKFYEKKGFSSLKSRVYGSAESIFKNMFQYDLNGNNMFKFVNPYDNVSSRNLDSDEKEFLKFVLFQLANTKFKGLAGNEFRYKSPNDPELVKLMTAETLSRDAEEYLLVPLEKGSVQHLFRRGPKGLIEYHKKEIQKMKSMGVKDYLKQRVEEKRLLTEYSDNTQYEEDVTRMKVHNSMLASYEKDTRRRMLSLHENSYFETNIEYLLIDSIEKLISTEELLNVAFLGKCLLAKMHILGDIEGDKAKKNLNESIEEVTKYLKLNVFGKSIMEQSSLALLEAIDPARRLMSHMLIALNLRSAFRDCFEGVWLNYVRTLNHYNTDLKMDFVRLGYQKVVKDIFNSDRDINILSELCLRYRLSNTDSAKISERAKTGRGGIFNPGYWAYSTLRGPDFLNRMTLFVARCLQDGVWEAYDINEYHLLIYDCKKDKRFKAFFYESNPKSEEYKLAKSRYYAAVTQYNKEHPNKTITFNIEEGALPEPYSLQEIELFKMFSNSIYGAYDKSQRAMYENVALGKTFGIFSTWLNGQTAAYFRKPGKYYEYFDTTDLDGKPIILKDEYSGNELWFDLDGNIIEKTIEGKFIDEKGNELTENIDLFVPVLARVPVLVQGIFYTLGTSLDILVKGGGWEEFKRRVWNNKYERANIKKLFSDLGMWLLFAMLFGYVLTPMYETHQKECDNVVENMMCELLFKSSANSYDGFLGPFAITKYILNDVNASAPNISIKLVSDGFKTLMGKKTWNSFLYSNAPIFRTFKNSARLANPKSFRVTD